MQKSPKEMLKKLIDARNESNPEIRDRLLEEAFAKGGTFTDGNCRLSTGREALTALFEEEVVDPERWVKLKGPVSPVGSRYVFRWVISSSTEEPQNELCWLELDADGRIKTLTVRHSVKSSPSAWMQAFRWARDHPAPALAVVGGMLYAALRISLAIFYNQLGLTPEEAGFANDELLRQSITLLGALLLLGLGAMLFNWLIYAPSVRLHAVARRLRLAEADSDFRLVAAAVLAPFALVLLATLVFVLEGDLTLVLVGEGALIACFLLVPRIALMLPPARRVSALAEEAVRRSQNLRPLAMLPGLAGVFVGALLISLPIEAHYAAGDVKNGGTATARLFPWRALPATVVWNVEPPPVRLPNNCHDLRFLGETDDHLYLFDRASQRTLRVPSASLTVSIPVDCQS